jgi:putative ABC transport system permease protein
MYEKLYKNDRVKLQLLYLLSGLAILISFLGLVGLIAFSLKSRIKEIAIRKVAGASTVALIHMLALIWVRKTSKN